MTACADCGRTPNGPADIFLAMHRGSGVGDRVLCMTCWIEGIEPKRTHVDERHGKQGKRR